MSECRCSLVAHTNQNLLWFKDSDVKHFFEDERNGINIYVPLQKKSLKQVNVKIVITMQNASTEDVSVKLATQETDSTVDVSTIYFCDEVLLSHPHTPTIFFLNPRIRSRCNLSPRINGNHQETGLLLIGSDQFHKQACYRITGFFIRMTFDFLLADEKKIGRRSCKEFQTRSFHYSYLIISYRFCHHYNPLSF